MLDPSTLVSVIICNYNYAQFVGDAIESALALDWPRIEVVVVDDGSTDGSRSVIEGYAPRVGMVTQTNSGQSIAARTGFARSRGEVLIFLDADDLLDPQLIRVMAPHWSSRVSKVQFQMKTIDAQGAELGSVFPQYYRAPSPAQVRHWALTADSYPTPPGSGNVYSRSYVRQVISDLDRIDRASDSVLLAAAPFLGDVVTIPQPLVSYRVHGANQGVMLELDASRFSHEWSRARRRFTYALTVARSAGFDACEAAFDRSLGKLVYRAASWRVAPDEHPIPNESVRGILAATLVAARAPQGYSGGARLALAVWILLVCAAPRGFAVRLVKWRFIPPTRPQIMKRLLGAVKIARASRASSLATAKAAAPARS